ncbi:hypothetical protein SDC9_210340 [bioreactor metagenome]|uniref:Uncharacterized protein n=1 Tax=bioreactor metagenome TaxID=1076179 RepID=A0A645JIS1_9ZZZZ
MKDEVLRTVMSLSVTLLLFSFIGIFYAAQGTAEYVVSVMAAVINLLIVFTVIIMLVKKRKNNA